LFGYHSVKKILEIPELASVGWVERSETHFHHKIMMGVAKLYLLPYVLSTDK